MKVGAHAVSVQYGGGFHYFLRSDYPNAAAAREAALQCRDRLRMYYSRGAKPTVHVWTHSMELPFNTSVEPLSSTLSQPQETPSQ